MPTQGWQKGTLLLAYQSFGVVYGDLCISPVYVYKNTFSGKLRLHEEDEEILGVLSLVFWSLTLIPLLKYIILVLGADDNGEGRRVHVGTRGSLFHYLKSSGIIRRERLH